MSDFAQVLFQGGYATPLLQARWKAKGALRGLSPNERLTEKGFATDAMRTAWRRDFPDRADLPNEPLHDVQGRMTVAFHRVFR